MALERKFEKDKAYDLKEVSEIMFQTSELFCKLSSSKIKPKKAKYFWNAECSKAVAIRRRSRRKYEKNPTVQNRIEYNRLSAKCKKIIKKEKRKAWIEFCSTLDHTTSESHVWKIFCRMEEKNNFVFKHPISNIYYFK